ncbi:MAG: 3-oxoacyl-[acyl-carrier protein] reductase, partial [uncultured Thermomicrobiales bacterium]
ATRGQGRDRHRFRSGHRQGDRAPLRARGGQGSDQRAACRDRGGRRRRDPPGRGRRARSPRRRDRRHRRRRALRPDARGVRPGRHPRQQRPDAPRPRRERPVPHDAGRGLGRVHGGQPRRPLLLHAPRGAHHGAPGYPGEHHQHQHQRRRPRPPLQHRLRRDEGGDGQLYPRGSGRSRPLGHPRQRPAPRPDPDRAAAGVLRAAPPPPVRRAAWPGGLSRRHRLGRGLPRLRRGRLRDRPGVRGRWRPPRPGPQPLRGGQGDHHAAEHRRLL